MSDDDQHWADRILGNLPTSRGSYVRTDPDYVDKVDRRNFEIYRSFPDFGGQRDFLKSLTSEERRALLQKIESVESFRTATPQKLTSRRSQDTLKIEIGTLNREVAAYLTRNPGRLHELTSRQFEELICEILKSMGLDAKLTKCSRDGGRDILVVFPSPFGPLLTIVECKRYRDDRPVGVEIVERFMYVLDRKDKASCGLIATTSYFSPEAEAVAKEYPYRLKLKDSEAVRKWISNYGQWIREEDSELWIPNSANL